MSIAKEVHHWIRERPFIVYALKRSLINYSSLARAIQKELGIKNFNAVIAAVRRFKQDIVQHTGREIIDALKSSILEIRTGIIVYIVRHSEAKELRGRHFHIIRGSEATTIITDTELDIDYIKKYSNLVEVRIKSKKELERIPGFVAFLYSAIAERRINIVETYSCYTDTIFCIDKKDLPRLIDTLSALGVK